MDKTRTRKIINIGGSYGITIPRQFIEKNNLRFGDTVGIVFDSLLLIVNPEPPPKEPEKGGGVMLMQKVLIAKN